MMFINIDNDLTNSCAICYNNNAAPTTIVFIIPGKPVPKERARTNRNHFYTPTKTRDFENLVKSCFKMSGCKRFNSEALEMKICVDLIRPKSSKRKYPTVVPDIDNYVKSITDSLNGLAYDDDRQIVSLIVSKRYGPEAKTIIHINVKE